VFFVTSWYCSAFVLGSLVSGPTPTVKIAGSWVFEFDRYENTRFLLDAPNSAACRLKQDDGDLSGDCGIIPKIRR
jgi:hypothetical protein